MEQFYIRRAGYCGNALFWWALESRGFTTDIRKAQKYSLDDAKMAATKEEDTIYPCSYIDNLISAHKLIIDSQYVDAEKEIEK